MGNPFKDIPRFILEIVAIILVIAGLCINYFQLEKNEELLEQNKELNRETYLTGL